MIGRILCVGIIGFVVSSSRATAQSLPPGFARNPYGVAGSPHSKTVLNMPKTSPVYDWIPYEGAQYITVRPYSTHYCFYDKTTKRIGRSDNERATCSGYTQRHRGRVWIISNEPDSNSQDNLSPTEYAYMFNTYFTEVRKIDPTAKFAIASVTGIVHFKEISHITTYHNQVFSEYQRLFNAPIPFDYWNLHAYYHGWDSAHPKTNPEMVNLVFSRIIDPYVQYRQVAANGRYANKPILVTEIGIAARELNLDVATVQVYMQQITNRLMPLVNQGIVEHFFWFYGGWSDDDFLMSNLLDSTLHKPTALGTAYAQEARAWDRQFGLEQADSNQDTKIGILDFSGLVKVFGTTNALLSLDTDPRITRADLAIFKQVFNLAN